MNYLLTIYEDMLIEDNFLQKIFFFLIYLSFFFFQTLLVKTSLANEYNVGHKSYSVWNTKENTRIDISLWFPTYNIQRRLNLGDYTVYASQNLNIAKIIEQDENSSTSQDSELKHKKLPLILISHDSGSTRYSHHTLAQELVKKGYLVVIPNHNNDDAYSMPHYNSVKSLTERAKQISATLDLILTDKNLSSFVDEKNITYVGFGNGGMASLLLLGLEFTNTKWHNYCLSYLNFNSFHQGQPLNPLFEPHSPISEFEEHAEFADHLDITKINPYCVEPFFSKMNTMVKSFEDYIVRYEESVSFYNDIINVRQKSMETHEKNIEAQTKRLRTSNNNLIAPPFILPFFPPTQKQDNFFDNRFSRMIFISPGYNFLFKSDELSEIKLDILLIGLTEDKVNLPRYQSEKFYEEMNKSKTIHQVLHGSDIWGLQAPCNENEVLIEICKTVSPEQREKSLHELTNSINTFIISTSEN